MKKSISFLLLLLYLFSLIACTPEKHRLIISERDREFLYEAPAKTYPGEQYVVLKTQILCDASLECFVNGESIGTGKAVKENGEYTYWEYVFLMPNEDTAVTFQTVDGMKG